jgi:inner membrane protein involved in colicin E2 resistance
MAFFSGNNHLAIAAMWRQWQIKLSANGWNHPNSEGNFSLPLPGIATDSEGNVTAMCGPIHFILRSLHILTFLNSVICLDMN